jgi:hypothetical protein
MLRLFAFSIASIALFYSTQFILGKHPNDLIHVIQYAKNFIGAIDLIAGIPGHFAQNAGLNEFLNILVGSLEWHIKATHQLFCE